MKKAKNWVIITVLLLFIACFAASCGRVAASPDGSGAISREDLIRIKAELLGTETDTPLTDGRTTDTDIVYWTDGGSVWHISRDCSYLEGKLPDGVNAGTEKQAKEAGKTHVCSRCSK